MVYVAGWLRKQNYIFNISLLSIVYCSLSSIPRLPNLWKELKKTPTSPSDTPFPFRRKSLHFYFPSGLQICEERGLLSSCSKIIINTKIYSLPAHLLPVEKERGWGRRWSCRARPTPVPLINPDELRKWSIYRAAIAEFNATLLFLYVTVLTSTSYWVEIQISFSYCTYKKKYLETYLLYN